MAKLSRTRRRPCTRLVGGILLILGLFTLFIFELSWQSSTTSNRVHTVRGHSLDMHNEERQYGPLPNAAPLQLSTDAISRTLNSTTSLSMLMQKAETSRPAAPYISRGISVSPDNIWLYGGFAPDRQLNRTRLLVVSIGGVGTTSLMDTLKNALSPHGVDVNDVNNQDGLKHTSYSELSRGAIAAFAPSVVIYVLGNPAAAIASHFRRGWPGSQLCLVNPAAESIIGGNSELNATMDPPPKTNFMTNYSLIVSDSGVDYFASFEHASSWLGATELGLTVFFASLQTLISSQEAVSRLLNIKPASSSLFEFQVSPQSNSSYVPVCPSTSFSRRFETPLGHLPAGLPLISRFMRPLMRTL